ncbi:TRAP transporter substrate-binding protein [Fulvimarina sp. 2208YS6-2-32]|uniref:TRAP transporter substrate-binding protein n=1 Tax=Fulvimarina uroteuthidis TaxID=3098149 RepID=A0ABU5I0G7_9HYPH|nr:TRAP transporter substrate-binding protein [Fulvimarina sp. 2208YS6-2-32]MDY8108886.1 TRAP transporter substrate-binding protein [Fulvimarina sp. 2208YS6-2-32]
MFRKLLAMTAAMGLLYGSAASAQTALSFGHVGEPGSLMDVSANRFKEIVAEKLGDEYVVETFGSSQLGSDEQMMQKMRLGTVDFALPSTVFSSVVPEFGVFEMPYLVKDREHMKKIAEEVVWPTLAPAAEEAGYKIIGVWENGFRHITNNVRPINTPADLSGLKLRTPSGEWRVRMFSSYGANPSPMSLSETFTALQTGVMDGQENPLTQISATRFQEVQKFLSLTGHVYTPAYVTVGLNKWNSWPEEVQTALMEAAAETQPFVYETAAKMDEQLLDELSQAMEVNEADKQAFIDASDPIYKEFGEQVEGGQEMVDKAIALGSGS